MQCELSYSRPPIQWRHGHTCANPAKDDEIMKGLDHLNVSVHSGEEKAHRNLINVYKYLMGGK